MLYQIFTWYALLLQKLNVPEKYGEFCFYVEILVILDGFMIKMCFNFIQRKFYLEQFVSYIK